MFAARLLPLTLLATLPAVAHAQRSLTSEYESAVMAWDRGDYVVALEGFQRLLAAPGGDRHLEPLALLTGELYHTTELTPDGRAPRFSADGRMALLESGMGAGRVLQVWDVSGSPRRIAEIAGTTGAVSPRSNRLVFLRVVETPELRAARAELEALPAGTERPRLLAQQQQVAWLEARATRLFVRDLPNGREREIDAAGLILGSPVFSADGSAIYVVGASAEASGRTDIYAIPTSGGRPAPLTKSDGYKADPVVVTGGRHLVYLVPTRAPLPQPPRAGAAQGGGGGPGGGGSAAFVVLDLTTGTERRVTGSAPSISTDGSTIAYVARDQDGTRLFAMPLAGGEATLIRESASRIDAPALSRDGRQIAYQMMTKDDWELYISGIDGKDERRLTREIQHDLFPRFLDDTTVLAVMGEGRHRRSHLYDARTGQRRRLFHNNTVRTIAPEYEWVSSPDGTRVLVVAERDGDTVSPERGIYLVDLRRRVTRDELTARLAGELAKERALRAFGERAFAPIAGDVRGVLANVSMSKLYEYQKALYDFDSKNITRPGNAPAARYILETLQSFGYDAELQWFEARSQGNTIRTANVLATLRGTENPELIYILSSHFDSHASGPGADDNTSGTSVLLETARVLAQSPLPATVVFAAFTGEESGLLGSREWVRQAVARGDKLVGALNNDMLGWSNDHRLDNTIRYSNPGIRDLQHAAAFLFTDLVTFDALYYKSTDAAAYYEAYGDIVGGIGSYPVLGNPHYHQPTDRLETINQELVRETAKTTTASVMILASSPSRIAGLTATVDGRSAVLTWTPSPEKGVRSYLVTYGPSDDPTRHRVTVAEPRARIENAAAGWSVAVKAVNARGLEGWDWARATIGR